MPTSKIQDSDFRKPIPRRITMKHWNRLSMQAMDFLLLMIYKIVMTTWCYLGCKNGFSKSLPSQFFQNNKLLSPLSSGFKPQHPFIHVHFLSINTICCTMDIDSTVFILKDWVYRCGSPKHRQTLFSSLKPKVGKKVPPCQKIYKCETYSVLLI